MWSTWSAWSTIDNNPESRILHKLLTMRTCRTLGIWEFRNFFLRACVKRDHNYDETIISETIILVAFSSFSLLFVLHCYIEEITEWTEWTERSVTQWVWDRASDRVSSFNASRFLWEKFINSSSPVAGLSIACKLSKKSRPVNSTNKHTQIITPVWSVTWSITFGRSRTSIISRHCSVSEVSSTDTSHGCVVVVTCKVACISSWFLFRDPLSRLIQKSVPNDRSKPRMRFDLWRERPSLNTEPFTNAMTQGAAWREKNAESEIKCCVICFNAESASAFRDREMYQKNSVMRTVRDRQTEKQTEKEARERKRGSNHHWTYPSVESEQFVDDAPFHFRQLLVQFCWPLHSARRDVLENLLHPLVISDSHSFIDSSRQPHRYYWAAVLLLVWGRASHTCPNVSPQKGGKPTRNSKQMQPRAHLLAAGLARWITAANSMCIGRIGARQHVHTVWMLSVLTSRLQSRARSQATLQAQHNPECRPTYSVHITIHDDGNKAQRSLHFDKERSHSNYTCLFSYIIMRIVDSSMCWASGQ